MAAITSPSGQIRGEKLLPEIGSLYASASSTYYPGGLVGHLPGSNLAIPVTVGVSPDLIIVGVTKDYLVTGSAVDSNGIALDADGITRLYVRIEDGLLGYFDTGTGTHAILDGNRDTPCWAFDNGTLYLDNPGGLLPFAGIVHHVDADGSVHLWIRSSAGINALFAPAEAGAGATYDDSARTVATSIPAGTITGGVYTATATGAFSTAQDGVTLVVGDKFVLPAGTITTLVVTTVQAAVYEVVSLGGTSSKFTFQLAPSWQLGASITPSTKVKIGGEPTVYKGTTWRADPATSGKVVGTDAPLLYPERVVIPLTLASGTHAPVTSVPLRAAGRFAILVDWTGGSPAATATSIQATTQTPGDIGTASIVPFECAALGTTVGTGSATCNLVIVQ